MIERGSLAGNVASRFGWRGFSSGRPIGVAAVKNEFGSLGAKSVAEVGRFFKNALGIVAENIEVPHFSAGPCR